MPGCEYGDRTYIVLPMKNSRKLFLILRNILASNEGGLKPRAYLKLGFVYYNTDNNAEALTNYKQLIQKYPQSAEADDATDIMKNIYVEEGKPNEYVELMQQNGKNISVSEADSLTYTSAAYKIQCQTIVMLPSLALKIISANIPTVLYHWMQIISAANVTKNKDLRMH